MDIHHLVLGAISMASFVAGLFFLRFWKSTKDRFFLYFAVSFWIQAISRTVQAMMEPLPYEEHVPFFYIIRLFAFGLILFAIIEKNLPSKTAK